MNATKKEIALGVLGGLAIGIPALVVALLLSRSVGEAPVGPPTPPVSIEALNTPLAQQEPEGLPDTPPAGTAVATLPVTPTEDATGAVTHTVAAGETLGAIALEYDVTVEDLVLANDIEDPDFIGQGTVLTIPVVAPIEVGGSVVTATVVAEALVAPGLPLSLSPPPSVTVDSLLAGSPRFWGDLEEAYSGSTTRNGLSALHTGTALSRICRCDGDPRVHSLRLRRTWMRRSRVVRATWRVLLPLPISCAAELLCRGRFFVLQRRDGIEPISSTLSTHEMTHLFTWNVSTPGFGDVGRGRCCLHGY